MSNFLLSAKHSLDAALQKKQSGILASIRGKIVRRMTRLLEIRKASRKGVSFLNLETEASGSMSAKSFLSRKVEVVKPSAVMSKKLPAESFADQAHEIAIASEIPARERIRRLTRLQGDAQKAGDSDGVAVAGHYVAQLKQGQKITKWKPVKK